VTDKGSVSGAEEAFVLLNGAKPRNLWQPDRRVVILGPPAKRVIFLIEVEREDLAVVAVRFMLH
jgi:hypothetical protein